MKISAKWMRMRLTVFYGLPDYEYVNKELKRTGLLTLKLLWQEYKDRCKAAGNIPVGYAKY